MFGSGVIQSQPADFKRLRMMMTCESEGDHVAALARVGVQMSDWFGTPGSVHAGPVGTLVAVGPAGTTVAAEGHRIGEGRIGVDRAAGQYGCAVFHFVVGAASLDKEAGPKYTPHVAVLLTTNRQMNKPYIKHTRELLNNQLHVDTRAKVCSMISTVLNAVNFSTSSFSV